MENCHITDEQSIELETRFFYSFLFVNIGFSYKERISLEEFGA